MIRLADALRPVLGMLAPVSPVILPVLEARGLISAETVVAPVALPREPMALRGGYAVSALACLGASPHSPVWLSSVPEAVKPGETLPPRCDAVLPKDGLSLSGAIAEVTRAVVPGENARLAGHDLRAGEVLVRAGDWILASQALLLEAAGITRLAVRTPRVAIEAGSPALCQWLSTMLAGAGCRIVNRNPDLAVHWNAGSEPRLALVPGEVAFITLDHAIPVVALPSRFDGLIAAYFALVLPLVERLRGMAEPVRSGTLRRKLTSTIGIDEMTLLRTLPEGLDPLATGAITLQALAQADCIALVPPDCEGYPAGTEIMTWPLDHGGSWGRKPEDFS